jgi:hypothetical protein
VTTPLDLDSDQIRRWTVPCGQHDYCDNTEPCACPNGDPRIVMVELVTEVERLRREVDALSGVAADAVAHYVDCPDAEANTLARAVRIYRGVTR